MNYQNILSVSSAEFARQYGHWRRNLSDQPLFITHHGEQTHVLLTIDSFTSLKSNAEVSGTEQIALSAIDLGQWISQGLLICDSDYTMRSANRVACEMMSRRDDELVGLNIWDALPELQGSVAQTYIRHTVETGEASSADLPSVFKNGAWRRLDVFSFAGGAAILIRDITIEVRDHRLADVKKAAFDAIALHGMIGYLRLSARGHIEQVDDSLCAMLKLPCGRLLGVNIADIVPVGSRVAFRDALEGVLRGSGAVQTTTTFLANDGDAVPVEVAITALRGTYGIEGAVIVVTRAT